MIHLIGVNHDVQRCNLSARRKSTQGGFTNEQIQYKKEVGAAIRDLSPDLLAEEDNPQFFCKTEQSILKALGCYYRVRHEFIDPDLPKRSQIGYKDKCAVKNCWELTRSTPYIPIEGKAHEIWHQFPIRERFWRTELGMIDDLTVLLICGDMHLETLPRTLIANGLPSPAVRVRGVGADTYSEKQLDQSALEWALGNLRFDDAECFCRQSASGPC